MRTANFDDWLNGIDLNEDKVQEVDALYCSIKCCRAFGRFDFKRDPVNGGKVIAPFTGENELLLVNDNAEAAFLRLLSYRFCDGDDIESWLGFQQALAKSLSE